MATTPAAPPARDGVGASRVQVMAGQGGDALAFLCARFPTIAESVWRSRFARGLVLDRQHRALTPDTPCRSGDTLFYYRELAEEPLIPFTATILHRDEHLLVVDKPHFLPVTPVGRFVQQSLLVQLKQQTGINALSPIHRLDRDTAGVMLFSCQPATRDAYQALFRERCVQKTYEAIAPLLPLSFPLVHRSRISTDAQFFRSCETSGEANSETRIELLSTNGVLAHYRLQPLTGRKHQLRVHMAALGAPLLHDRLYPVAADPAADDYSKPLQLLARSLIFRDPFSGETRHFTSRQQLLPVPPVSQQL